MTESFFNFPNQIPDILEADSLARSETSHCILESGSLKTREKSGKILSFKDKSNTKPRYIVVPRMNHDSDTVSHLFSFTF